MNHQQADLDYLMIRLGIMNIKVLRFMTRLLILVK
jgi:hypothetical protein